MSAPKNTFTDLAGRTWLLKLNYGLSTKIQDALGVDLANAHNGQAFQQLGRDPLLFIKTLTMLVERQLDDQKVTPEQFVEQLDDVTLDAATGALREMIILFTRAAMRPLLDTMLTKADEARDEAIALAQQKINSPAMTKAIQRELAKLDEQIETALSTPTASSTSGPASSA